MSEKLSLDRDFTRFFDDPTFPHKVTVCVGDKRMVCSGALLAQQSSVLEKKFREDDGVLMFEELLDVENSNSDGIMECIHYLHGAELQFRLETLHVVLKFSSMYQVEDMFEQALKWLQNSLDQSRSVLSALNFLKLSRSLNKNHEAKIKSVICRFVRQNRVVFTLKCKKYLDMITGPDLIIIIRENPVNSDILLKEWASLSVENGNYIVDNHSNIDFKKVFPNTGQFISFVATLSSSHKAADRLRKLLDIQTIFFESPKHKTVIERGKSSDNPITNKSKARPGSLNFELGTNSASSSDTQNNIARETENRLAIVEPSTHDSENLQPSASSQKLREFTRLYIGNLPPDTEVYTIKRMFSGFGKIADVRLKFRTNGENYGFIMFESSSSAHNLLQRSKTRNYEIDGHTLVINVAHQRNLEATEDSDSSEEFSSDEYDSDESSGEKFTRLYIGNLPPDIEVYTIKRMFSGFGKITNVTIEISNNGGRYGYISFENSRSAFNLHERSKMENYGIDGYTFVIMVAIPEDSDEYDSDESSEEFMSTQLYIGNLPPGTEENAVKRMFCGFGKITDVKITFRKRGKNFGFITFEKSISAYNLLQRSATKEYELHGYTLVISLANNQN